MFRILFTITALCLAQSQAATIGCWGFEEGAGTTVSDCSGHGNNGVLSGGAIFSSLVPGNPVPGTQNQDLFSLSLNGVNGGVTIPDSPILHPATGFTIDAWIKGNGWVVFGKQIGNGTANSFQLEIKGGSLIYQLTDTANHPSFASYAWPGGTDWHHIAGEWDGSRMLLVLDGSVVATTPFAGPIAWDTNPVLIGADNDRVLGGGPACCWFNGLIDEVRISDVAVSQTVPEPCTVWLVGIGAVLLGIYRLSRTLPR